jgi:hypothetical protein
LYVKFDVGTQGERKRPARKCSGQLRRRQARRPARRRLTSDENRVSASGRAARSGGEAVRASPPRARSPPRC